MSSITWVHLSDLHFSAQDSYDQGIVKPRLLQDIGKQCADEIQPDFVIISGDIALSGKSEEYEQAKPFLDELLSVTRLSQDRLFLVPGNHDVEWHAQELLSRNLYTKLGKPETIDELLTDSSQLRVLLSPMDSYAAFIRSYFRNFQELREEPAYYYVQQLEAGDLQVALIGLNSAWLAGRSNTSEGLVLGESQVEQALFEAKEADIRIAIMHHPFGSLRDFDRNNVEPLLLNRCDFILHGHLHETGMLVAGSSPDDKAMVISAGACYETRYAPNSYNIVRLDLEKDVGEIHLRRFSDARGGFWAKDTLTYRDTPDGIYTFRSRFSSKFATLSTVPLTPLSKADSFYPIGNVKIFLSYVKEDELEVRKFYNRLRDAGFSPWMASMDLLPGEDWYGSIQKAIRNSDFFLIFMSNNSISIEGNHHREIRQALEIWQGMLESDIFIIPVRLEPCEIPEPIAQFYQIDLFDQQSWYQFLRSLQAGMTQRGFHIQLDLDMKNPRSENDKDEEEIPGSFKLKNKLKCHEDIITRHAWSPDGHKLASCSPDKTIIVWDVNTGKPQQTLNEIFIPALSLAWSRDNIRLAWGTTQGDIYIWNSITRVNLSTPLEHKRGVGYLAWSPNGKLLASASTDTTIKIWSMDTYEMTMTLRGHTASINTVVWSPDGTLLASGAEDNTVRIWNAKTEKSKHTLQGHTAWVGDVQWSPNGKWVASAGWDHTVRLWDPAEGTELRVLVGHTGPVRSLSFSSDSRLLASKSQDGTVRLWRCDTWQTIAVLKEPTGQDINPTPSIAFCPRKNTHLLATLGEMDRAIRIWELDLDTLLGDVQTELPAQHINAKVVLVGEQSVGKSGLGFRIATGEYQHTDPTHGAHFWQIPVSDEVNSFEESTNINAEVTLWDLAGQPDYHLIHQLFLDKHVTAALLVFDASNRADPFHGVHYWARVLNKHIPSDAVKFLVAGRCNLCPPAVDQQEINKILAQYGLDKYWQTCAQLDEGIKELWQELMKRISWDKLPRTTSPRLFHFIRKFLLEQKQSGVTLIGLEGVKNEIQDLYSEQEISQAELDSVVRLLQSQGLIYRLDPTPRISWILLRPELINQYASSIVIAARNHPRGIGAVIEHDVVCANLAFTGINRLDPIGEKTLIESVIELFINHDLCFREMGMLVFPSQINTLRSKSVEESHTAAVTYRFSGSVEMIYASLVVRLNNSRYFRLVERWKHAAEFSQNGTRMGFEMNELEPGIGSLDIYFQPEVNRLDMALFYNFILDHLKAKDIEVEEHVRLYCHQCDREIKNRNAIQERIRMGNTYIRCQYCDVQVIIPKSFEELYQSDSTYREKAKELTGTSAKSSEETVEAFKKDSRFYAGDDTYLLHILHLSDIHLGTKEEALQYRVKLETDLMTELEVTRLEYLVISGDIANYSTKDEYEAAFELVNGIVSRFGLDPGRVVIVPGNHDLNWGLSKKAYEFIYKEELPNPLPEGRFIPADAAGGALIRNEEKYQKRFDNFSEHFYKKVYSGALYPLDYKSQSVLWERPDDRIVFIGLNSNWEIDHHKPNHSRSGVNMTALAQVLDQFHDNDEKYRNWLKIAVWHHPVTGPDTMKNVDFLEQLAVNGFQICMHGHIHQAEQSFYNYDSDRRIHIVGAGTFGAPVKDQVPGIPLQYNLLVLDPRSKTITVETRKNDKPDGAWMADARWKGKKGEDPKPRYSIELKDSTFSDD